MHKHEDIQVYLDDVIELLERHKLVEDLMQRQRMPRHELVEN